MNKNHISHSQSFTDRLIEAKRQRRNQFLADAAFWFGTIGFFALMCLVTYAASLR